MKTIRELTEKEKAALRPELLELEAITRESAELKDRKEAVEDRLQRLCSLMRDEGQVVDLETMTVIDNPEKNEERHNA